MAGIHNALAGASAPTIPPFAFSISTNQTNANLRALAVSAGWDQNAPVSATINSGIIISSNATGTPALTVDGSFPNGVTLTNSGNIVGMGGAGGNGGTGSASGTVGGNGGAGGTALSVSVAVTINNTGTVAGGGGGGGGGGVRQSGDPSKGFSYFAGGGGGGGRSSNAANSAGGAIGGPYNLFAVAGAAGTYSAAGSGGRGAGDSTTSGGDRGGDGGGWGAAGQAGYYATPSGTTSYRAPGSGGAAGNAVLGNSNITWIATGTRLGGIS